MKQLETITIDGVAARKRLWKIAQFTREFMEKSNGTTISLIPNINNLIELSQLAEEEVIKNLKFINGRRSIIRGWKCFDIEGELDLKWLYVPNDHLKILVGLELCKITNDFAEDLAMRYEELKSKYKKKKKKDVKLIKFYGQVEVIF